MSYNTRYEKMFIFEMLNKVGDHNDGSNKYN